MITALKAILVRMAATGFKALMTRTMLVFVLRLYARGTETRVDNKAVDLIEALLRNDIPATQEAAQKVADTWLREREERRNAEENQ